jgi:hypothetical protein
MHGTVEEFFDSRIRLATVCPETALMYAVLEDALFCFQGQIKQRARRAEEWFFSDDTKSLYSFVSICKALEIEPEHIRKRLKRWDPPNTILKAELNTFRRAGLGKKSIGRSYGKTRSA